MTVVDIVKSGAKRQVSTLRTVVRTPRGPFSTVDQVVRNARMTAKQIKNQAGYKVGIPKIVQKYRPSRLRALRR